MLTCICTRILRGNIILDDCFQDDYSGDKKLREHLTFVDALKGLQKEDVVKACEVLNRQIN